MTISPRELKKKYADGDNIGEVLRNDLGVDQNTQEIIEVSYDMQSGSYIAAMSDAKVVDYNQRYTARIAEEILATCAPMSILEAGVGEATTLASVMSNLPSGTRGYGFDLSWSRISFAQRWLSEHGLDRVSLCTGNLLNIPFADNSIDVVYTSHSIEPNGGQEKPILEELYRVARKYVVLLEPGYEFASQEARERMLHHGYCRNLGGICKDLGYKVIKHERFPIMANPLNPTSLLIIEKEDSAPLSETVFACPKFKTPLVELSGAFYSPEALVAYPVLGGVPCLRIENGVFASHFQEVSESR